MTQKDAARVVDIHPVRFNAIVKGRVDVGVKTAKKLKKYFGGSLEVWCTRECTTDRENLLSDFINR